MSNTPNLSLPLIAAAQAQKHVTHNVAIEQLDALVQLSVVSISTTPPSDPAEGGRYICAENATDDWASHDNEVAAWQSGGWVFYAPETGWRAWVADVGQLMVFDGTTWTGIGGGGVTDLQNVPEVGVNATADTANRLAVSSPNTLFNHEGDDHRLKINRATSADTASVVFQTGFSGRAEFGNTGDDRFRLRVSNDGANWVDAFNVDPTTGKTQIELENPISQPQGSVIEPAHSSAPLFMPYGQAGYSPSSHSLLSLNWRFKLPLFMPYEFEANRIVFQVKQAGGAGARIRIGVRRWDRAAGWSFRELILETGEVNVETPGVKDVPVGPAVLSAGWYIFDLAHNDPSIRLLGQYWGNMTDPAFGFRIHAGTVQPINTLYDVIPYGPLPADDDGATYSHSHYDVGNFCIGLA